jgi:tape measure domain-containing protein
MGPSSQLGAGYYAVGKGLQSIKQAYAGVRTFLDTKRLPLSGAIAELAGEFGTAIKQVLLYGTAYKALAFFTSLPGQAFEAAKGLATYRNQLQAVTAESKTFDQSLAFVDNLAQRFNVPLESARQGFVKLYASMQPAGFGQDQIEGLFTGISKAAAAFGLSSDKVDRVNYAFAQMASKGQIMSEELKGQLGDVLPGALALFAQAAQMSIPEFSKAMEDGAFKGKAMTQVLDNVAILMNTKFGPAAQGAAKTLQGALNQMQNNLQLMYESFTPVVNAFAATFGPQVNSLIKDVTSTMQALTGTFLQAGEGFNTLSPRAQGFYTAIKDLEPAVRQAGAALLDLGSRFASLLPAIVNAVAATISFASSPLGRAALLATVAISTLTATLNILETTGIKAAVKAVYVFIGSLLKIPAATGIARAGIIALKLAITGLVIGGILMGLDLLIGRLLKIGDTANDSEKDLRGMKKALDDMAGSQDIEGTSRAYLNAKTKLAAARIENEKAFKELYNAKLAENLNDDPRAAIAAVTAARLKSEKTYNNVINAQKELQAAERARANAVALKERQDKETQGALQKIDLSGGEGKKQSLESYYSLQDQLAKAQTQADIDRIQSEFDHKFKLLNSYYDLQEARANSFQKITIAFQKELLLIEQRRQEATLKARLDVMKAQNSIAGGTSGTGGTGGGGRGLGSGISGYITGDPSSPYYQADHGGSNYHEHLSFVSRQAAEEAYNKLRGAGIQVTEFLGKSRVGRHTTGSAHYGGLAFDVPGAQVPVGKERELTARVQAILGIGGRATSGAAVAAGAPRKVTGNEKRDLLAEQAASNAQIAQSTINLRANEMAAKETEIAFANYVAAIAPAAEQELQNRLLQKRIDLMSSGVTGEFLETQIKIFEAEEKTRIAGQLLDKNNKSQAAGYEALKTALPGYIVLLKAAALAQQSVAFATAKSELNQRLAMARVFTADDELRVGLAQKYPGDIGKQTEEFDLTKRVMMIEKAKENLQNMASSISNAFGEAFKGIITGSSSVRDALAGLFQSIADSFADMVAQMITEWLKTQLVKGFASLFSSFIPGAGSSIAPGPVAQSAGVVQRPGFYGPAFANGGIAVGGFTAFAAGGVVSGPTLGLVGEGRYNEAIIPLPDGKSVPVDLGDTMGGTGGEISTNIVINVNNGQMQKEGGGNASSLGRKMEGAVKQVIVNELRPGGVLAGRR